MGARQWAPFVVSRGANLTPWLSVRSINNRVIYDNRDNSFPKKSVVGLPPGYFFCFDSFRVFFISFHVRPLFATIPLLRSAVAISIALYHKFHSERIIYFKIWAQHAPRASAADDESSRDHRRTGIIPAVECNKKWPIASHILRVPVAKTRFFFCLPFCAFLKKFSHKQVGASVFISPPPADIIRYHELLTNKRN